MAEVYRETRVYRDEPSDDEDRYKSTTVRRYKVKSGSRYDEPSIIEVDDDRRSRYSGYTGRPVGELLDVERRATMPERPRSAFEPYGERSRSIYYERDVEREPERTRVSTYEAERERDRDRDWDKQSRVSHRHHHHHDDEEIRVEKRVEERFEDAHGHDVERYRKETEYYSQADPPPAPVIIRQRAPEPQKIIVQEAPPPAPIVVPRQDPGVVVVRDKEINREVVRREPSEEEYWYRHERREVGPYDRDRDRDRDWGAVGRHDPRRRDHDDDDYYYRRTVVRRERSESPPHKRYLAEGALAAAGLTALLSARRDKDGELQENRGKKVLAGAALGALGTEAVRRAHSAYGDRWGDKDESPDRHSILKKGLGVAAVALAAAGAAKYYQTNKIEKEESRRGRSRRRERNYSGDDYSRSRTRSRSKSRRRSLSTMAKAALGTAATAGVVKHLRDRSKSKGRSQHRSRSRSKSVLRRGAEVAGVAAAAGVATKMWKNHKDKKDDRGRDYDYSSDEDDRRRHRTSHSRSRSRSRARSLHSDAGADPELGLVEYGHDPLPPAARRASRGYHSGVEESDRRRRRHDRDRSASNSDTERKRSKSRLRDMAAAGAAAVGIKEFKDRRDQAKKERRSRERESRDRSSRERGSRDRGSRDRGARDRGTRRGYDEDQEERDRYYTEHRDRPHSPPTASGGAYYPPYPENTGPGGFAFPEPTSHGANGHQPYVPTDYMGYPPPPPPGPPPAPTSGPAGGFPPATGAAPGFPPAMGAAPGFPPTTGPASGFPPAPPGPPPTGGNLPPDHVSENTRSKSHEDEGREDGASNRTSLASASLGKTAPETDSRVDGVRKPEESASVDKERLHPPRSVTFIPLSPKSSMTMERHKREQAEKEAEEAQKRVEAKAADDGEEVEVGSSGAIVPHRPRIARRRSSDPSSDRPLIRRRPGRDYDPAVFGSDDSIELLPDRFDAHGRPLDGHHGGHPRWTTRRGEFERRPRHSGDWDVRGAWHVGGTEGEAVEKLARSMTDVLDGRQHWTQLLGSFLGGGLLQQAPEHDHQGHGHHDRGHARIEDDEEHRQAKHRKQR